MASRILTWFFPYASYPASSPAFYIEEDMEKVAVRIHAVNAPSVGDLTVDIKDDGVSIFSNHATQDAAYPPELQTVTPDTTIHLPKGQTSEEEAEDFTPGDIIEEGSWVTCELVNAKGAKNITVQLELNKVGETE